LRKQPETLFKEKVLSKLRTIPNIYVLKVQMVATRGVPDILMCHRGQFIAWELKVGKNKPDQLQAFTLDRINKAGGMALVVTPENFAEEFRWLETLGSSSEKDRR